MPHVELTPEPIDLNALVARLHRPEAGAVVMFAGTVRAEQRAGAELAALEYHAYEDMAVEQMRAIVERAGKRFEILDAAVVHRLGKLPLGETSIGCVVVAAHRAAAFEACQWIIDAVKADVPIWKQDVWSDGTREWVDPTDALRNRDQATDGGEP